jgi:hypothetical protein
VDRIRSCAVFGLSRLLGSSEHLRLSVSLARGESGEGGAGEGGSEGGSGEGPRGHRKIIGRDSRLCGRRGHVAGTVIDHLDSLRRRAVPLNPFLLVQSPGYKHVGQAP